MPDKNDRQDKRSVLRLLMEGRPDQLIAPISVIQKLRGLLQDIGQHK